MPRYLCLSVRFLDPAFHGRGEGAECEWPPSPLRLFQALVAAAAARWRGPGQFPSYARPALAWLEEAGDPLIVAPPAVEGVPYRLSVPNNAMDVVARAWCRGNLSNVGDANPATHRSMKTVRPMHLNGTDTPEHDAVHYLWELSDAAQVECEQHAEVLFAAARSVVALGWGIDMAIGTGKLLSPEDADRLPGERWRPGTAALRLRVPRRGTLSALLGRHEAFLQRLPPEGGFVPVPPLTTFEQVGYRRDTDPRARPFAAFALLDPQAERFYARDSVRGTPAVAGMLRHATAAAAALHRPDAPGWVDTFVLGHGDGAGQRATTDQRLAYLPLPTIEERRHAGRLQRVVGSIRRVLVVEPAGGRGAELAWVRQRLPGQPLVDERSGRPVALLSLLPGSDPRLRWYMGPADAWTTVTPVVLPGHDDGQPAKTERLLRKAVVQAGYPPTLAQAAELEWRAAGFVMGVGLAGDYTSPAYLRRYPKYHVHLRWRDAMGQPLQVRGPLALGAGRYLGLGLFVTD